MDLPRTRYAKSGDVNIAYQVVGSGPLDLVYVQGFVSHLEENWLDPQIGPFLERLASFSRLIVFDKRGTGMSDRVPEAQLPSLEARMDDVRAVLDAAGSERAAVFGFSEGAAMCTLFAATYPERSTALVVYGGYARWMRSTDYPWAPTREQHESAIAHLEAHWGEPQDPGPFAPSLAGDVAAMQRNARYDRLASSPGAAATLVRMNIEADTRAVLPSIHVPTLVLHRRGDRLIRPECGRYLAEHIHGARYVELAGDDHLPWVGDAEAVLSEIEEFLTGIPPRHHDDRVLSTVLLTDIVGSTKRAGEVGDRRWTALLDDVYRETYRCVNRFGGHVVKTTGDGVLATFDGPGRAVRCACAIRDAVPALGLEIRAGLHTGEIELRGDDVAGMAVHIAARVSALAGPGEVLVSGTLPPLVAGSGIAFEDRGDRELKGVPGTWKLFAVQI